MKESYNATAYEAGREMAQNDFLACKKEGSMRREAALRTVVAADHRDVSEAAGYQETCERLWREHYVAIVAQELQEARRFVPPCLRCEDTTTCPLQVPCEECIRFGD